MKLKPSWCEDEKHSLEGSIYCPDNSCRCGVDKHHYHCTDCGGISQVG